MGGSKTQTTQTSNEPWSAAQPALRTSINAAQSLYNQGIGSRPYTGSTVVPYANQTITGLAGQERRANDWQNTFDNNFDSVAANINNNGLNDLQRESIDALSPMASGQMLSRNNPFTEAVVDRAADQMSNQVSEVASASGRHGSGAHQGVLAREIGDMASSAYAQDYSRERQFQQDAIGSLFNAGQQQHNNINQAAAALQNAYGAAQQPLLTYREVGSAYEDLATRQKNDELRIFNESQNAPWDNLARLNAVASGAGQLGSTSQVQAQGPSALQRGVGGALAGAPLGPLGIALGGLGGLLF